MDEKIWAQRAQRELPNNPDFVVLGAIKPLYLCSHWSDLDTENMGVEGATSAFQRPRSDCSRCYSFGEKNC
ncbi:hypothetical protein V1477_017807 [Vespula maculifrons]|uniref:Uncharacterized protein n=1 Tax=Vespula maculifrons TaxID=7453 RepID=A0ABD2B1F3_VESMC